ncbi:MAG: tRNA (guanosine(46)-N7)-methyltransferase TrmB [Verrucomicrobiae bacterium]|nr:tRNA (guanosine(46)-N7)-methyltransferase TrmB [Verrucomicrobiae bacterium]
METGFQVGSVIYQPESYFVPLEWARVFGRDAPVEVDVGCGKGNFLVWVARNRPEHNFLGVDRQLKRLRKADKKVQRAGLTNVRLLRLEFGYVIARLIPSASVTAYYIFFPDPWPKRRHAKHRLFRPEFVVELERTLVQGGEVHLATDDAAYFEQIRALMGGFELLPPLTWPAEAQTEFERIFLARGQPIYRARWRKA